MPTRDPVRCTFCDDLAIGFGFIQPPMCQRHYEVARLMLLLERTPSGVTLPAMERLLVQVTAAAPAEAIQVTFNELPRLVWDLLQNCERLF